MGTHVADIISRREYQAIPEPEQQVIVTNLIKQQSPETLGQLEESKESRDVEMRPEIDLTEEIHIDVDQMSDDDSRSANEARILRRQRHRRTRTISDSKSPSNKRSKDQK